MPEYKARFCGVLKDGAVWLSGNLDDTYNPQIIDEHLTTTKVLDLSGIKGASWNGLHKLIEQIDAHSGDIALRAVPKKVYKGLRLFDGVGERIKIESIGVELFHPEEIHKVFFSYIDPSRISDNKRASGQDFIQIGGNYLSGIYPQLNPARLIDSNKAPHYPNPWCADNREEVYLWHALLSFWGSTIHCALGLAETQYVGILTTLHDMSSRVEEIEHLIRGLNTNYKDDLAEALRTLIDPFASESSTLFCAIEGACLGLELLERRFQVAVMGQRNLDHVFFSSLVTEAAGHLQKLESLRKYVEVVGVKVSNRVLNMNPEKTLRTSLSKLDGKGMSESQIKSLEESIAFLPEQAGSSWDGVMQVLEGQLGYIRRDRHNCFVVLQSYDLMRQIIEHRIDEADEFCRLTKVHGVENPAKVLSELMVVLKSNLVTDQEKYSSDFFFPDDIVSKVAINTSKPSSISFL